jgi:hypothetical protein
MTLNGLTQNPAESYSWSHAVYLSTWLRRRFADGSLCRNIGAGATDSIARLGTFGQTGGCEA